MNRGGEPEPPGPPRLPNGSATGPGFPSVAGSRFYFFASSAEGSRDRRLADATALCGALLLLGLSVADQDHPAAASKRLAATLVSLPVIAAELGRAVIILSSMFALAIVLAACVGRRWGLVRDLVVAAVAALVESVVIGRVVAGEWPQVGSIDDVTGARDFPAVRIAVLAAILFVALPYLSRPSRWLSRIAVLLSGFAAVILEVGALSDVVAALAIGWGTAAVLHLVFGSPAGAPTVERVRGALRQLGVDAHGLQVLGPRAGGGVAYRAIDDAGRRLVVHVAGRDAHNVQLAARLWRSLWQRGAEARLSFTRLQMVEHEALMALLAARAGVGVPQLVAVGEARPNDALIVFADAGECLDALDAEQITSGLLEDLWAQLLRAHTANIAHRSLDLSSIFVGSGDEVVFSGWGSAVATTDPAIRAADVAALLALTTMLVGPQDAVRVAEAACGDAGVLEALPFLQSATFGPLLRKQIREEGVDLGALRAHAADALDVDPPEIVRLHRVTLGTVLLALLFGVAMVSLLSWIGDVGLVTLIESIADADGAWLALALVIGQTQFLAGAVSVQGSVPIHIAYGPTVVEQMAIAFVKLAVPSSAARVITNVRYLQFQGVPRVTAFGAAGLDSVAGFIVQITVLALLVFVDAVGLESGALLDLSFDRGDIAWGQVLLAVGAIVAAVVGLLMIRRIRDRFRDLARETGDGTRRLVDVLRSWQQIARLLGGNFASDLVLAITLWTVCRAYGVELPLATLLAIHLGVSLINGFVPVPGGIGIWETLLSTGLIAAGVSEVDALAIAITWRALTFYLPPIWGAYSMRWLARHGDI